MPGIVLFNRKWTVASDDFVYPALTLATFHLTWITSLACLLAYYFPSNDNKCVGYLWKHCTVYLVILIICFVVEILIAKVSSRGTITDAKPRESLRYFLYLRLILLLAETVWMVVGAVWVKQTYQSCPADWITIIFTCVFFSCWFGIVFVVLLGWCTFDSVGTCRWFSGPGVRTTGVLSSNLSKRRWRRRCKLLFCRCKRDAQNDQSIHEIADLFSCFFQQIDLVLSDVLAGLVILRQLYKEEKLLAKKRGDDGIKDLLSGTPIYEDTKFLDLFDGEELSEYLDIVHYMKYCVASYSWPLYCYMNLKSCHCRQLCCVNYCHWCHPRWQANVVGDNVCACNYSTLKKLTDFTKCEIMYVSYLVKLGQPAFLVAIDHIKESVVVCIRGTLSKKDVMTDLLAGSTEIPGCETAGGQWFAHKGIVSAATFVASVIKEQKLIEACRSSQLNGKKCSSYRLMVVGHSLGAGTAAVLTLMLQNEHPDVQCYSYAPPGGLMNLRAAEFSRKFTTSIVLGQDIIPRLGVSQIDDFRLDVECAIQNCRVPKWRVVMQCSPCCKMKIDEEWINLFKESRNTARNVTKLPCLVAEPLFPPGKILHVVRKFRDRSVIYPKKHLKFIYKGVWIGNKDLNEITVSSHAMRDHLPDEMLKALEYLYLHERLYSRGSYRFLDGE